MENHQNILKLLCRVCGKKPKTYTHKKNSDACNSLLITAFGIDVRSESQEVYPTLVCNNCYLSMKRIKISKESGVALKSQLSLSHWFPHSNESCPVCDGGGSNNQKKSVVRTGRPPNNDIVHLSREIMREINKINPRKYSDLPLQRLHFIPTPILPSLLCRICNCVPNRPLELLPCHHLICISCISKITETQILTCPCTESSERPQVVGPHPVVSQLLDSLKLSCPKGCGQVITLQDLQEHSCARRNLTPLLSQITVQELLDSEPGSAVEQYAMGLLTERFLTRGTVTYKTSSGKVRTIN